MLWTKCRVVYSQLRPKTAPDLVGLTGRPIAMPLAGGGMHQPRAGSAQEARLCPVQMQGAASAPRAEEIRLVLAEGLWNTGQDDRLINGLPFAVALSELEVQSDFILPAFDPDPAGRLAVVTAPAPTSAPAFTEDAGLCHAVGGKLAMRFDDAPTPRIVPAAA